MVSSRPPFAHHSTSYANHHTPSSSSSTSSSSSNPPVQMASLPYRDYPPEKSEADHVEYAHYAQSASRLQPEPQRTIYNNSRRSSNTPGLQGYSTESRCKDAAGGRLGKALIVGWVITTLMFIAATAFYKGELFSGESTTHPPVTHPLYRLPEEWDMLFGNRGTDV